MKFLSAIVFGLVLSQGALAFDLNQPWSDLLKDKNLEFDFPQVFFHDGYGQALPLSKFCRTEQNTLKTSGVSYCAQTVVEKMVCQDGGNEFGMSCNPWVEGQPIYGGLVYETPKCVKTAKMDVIVPVNAKKTMCTKYETVGGAEGDFYSICKQESVVDMIYPLNVNVKIYRKGAGKDGIPGSTLMGSKAYSVPNCK